MSQQFSGAVQLTNNYCSNRVTISNSIAEALQDDSIDSLCLTVSVCFGVKSVAFTSCRRCYSHCTHILVLIGAHVQVGTSDNSPINLSGVQITTSNIDCNCTSRACSIYRETYINRFSAWLSHCRGFHVTYLAPFKLKKWLILLLKMARPAPTVIPVALSSGSRNCIS